MSGDSAPNAGRASAHEDLNPFLEDYKLMGEL